MPSKKPPIPRKKRKFIGITRFGTKKQLPRSMTNYNIRIGADGRIRMTLKGITHSYTGLSQAIRGMRHSQAQYEKESEFLHQLQYFVTSIYSKYKNTSLKFIDKQTEKQIIDKIELLKSRFKGIPILKEKKQFPRQLSSLIKLLKKHNINAFIPACKKMIANCKKRRKNIPRIMKQLRERELVLNAKRIQFGEQRIKVTKELIATEEKLKELSAKGTTKQKKETVQEQLELIEPRIEDWGERATQTQIENIAIHLIRLANVFRKSTRIFGKQQSQLAATARLVRKKEFSQARNIIQQTITELKKISV